MQLENLRKKQPREVSAGITICVSMISAITKCPVKDDIAMTGELTLRGDVLAIGGLKEKSLAAHRSNYIKSIIIPKQNTKDIEDIPEEVKSVISVMTCKDIHEVIGIALPGVPTEKQEGWQMM